MEKKSVSVWQAFSIFIENLAALGLIFKSKDRENFIAACFALVSLRSDTSSIWFFAPSIIF